MRAPILLAASTTLALAPCAQDPLPPPADALPGPGRRWELAPTTPSERWTEYGWSRLVPSGSMSLFAAAEGRVVAQLAQVEGLEGRGMEALRFEPVAVDGHGRPVRRAGSMSMGNGRIRLHTWYFTPDDGPEAVARIGLAVLDFEGRLAAAAAAREEAEAIGARVLPPPIVGEPFPFELPTLSGDTVRSDDLRGKVILLDAWATW